MKLGGIKILDLPVLILSVAALIASVLLLRRGSGNERLLVVRSPKGEFVYPLSKDAVYRIEGAIGISEIEVSDGRARFKDSPCPGKTCVMSGELSLPGAWAACLPNQVFIRIEGEEPDGSQLDAIAQ